MDTKKTFYITTPIYYPSDKLHIGHSYCSVAADTLARFKKLTGHDVYFLTGTDEHGQKIERRAKEAGITPQAFVDNIVAGIKDLWKLMDVEYDDFIRTTDERHKVVVQKVFKQLYDQGDIYKSEYEGLYCTPCEAFWTETQAKDGICPDCGRSVELVREESYFFKVSKYQQWLIDYISENPDFIQPPSRANEMLTNFLRPGLEDLCVSRTSFKWGIPVDFDPKHVVYVWIDALSNYISALGYGSENTELYDKFWPADVHLVGKEIIRFHTIIWPIMLKALNLPLPKQVFGHGWLVLNGGKMSKSKGNVVDPVKLCERYTSDAIRYFLMREMPFGSDGVFSNEALLVRINSDLANDLGNLVSRTVAMIEKFYGGVVPAPNVLSDLEANLKDRADALPKLVEDSMNGLQFSQALNEIWKLVSDCNKYIDLSQPWVLGKSEEGKPRLDTVMYYLAECVRIIGVMIAPFMPRTPERIYTQLGLTEYSLKTWDSVQAFGGLKAGTVVKKGDALFPRIDVAKEMIALNPTPVAMEATEIKAEVKSDAKSHAKFETKVKTKDEIKVEAKVEAKVKLEPKKEDPQELGLIAIDDFFKVQLKLAKVMTAEKVEKSDKLLKLSLKVGDEMRTVVSGIAKHYQPDEMVGKTVVLVANLKPAKLRGIMSEGMILCASTNGGSLKLITVDGEMPDGSSIS